MKCLLGVLWCVCLGAADPPHIYYSKSFPNSVPAFVSISVDRTGAGQYKEKEDDDQPISFTSVSRKRPRSSDWPKNWATSIILWNHR